MDWSHFLVVSNFALNVEVCSIQPQHLEDFQIVESNCKEYGCYAIITLLLVNMNQLLPVHSSVKLCRMLLLQNGVFCTDRIPPVHMTLLEFLFGLGHICLVKEEFNNMSMPLLHSNVQARSPVGTLLVVNIQLFQLFQDFDVTIVSSVIEAVEPLIVCTVHVNALVTQN